MSDSNRIQNMHNAIAIAVGTVFFLLFLLLCFHRELGPARPWPGLLIFVLLIGGGTAVTGGVMVGSFSPENRRLGKILVAQGILLAVLTLIAWTGLMGPVPLPPE